MNRKVDTPSYDCDEDFIVGKARELGRNFV